MSATQELIRQLILFTSILAGFSFASVLQLLTWNISRRLASWMIGSLTGATGILLSATFIGCVLLYKLQFVTDPKSLSLELTRLYQQAGLVELWLLLIGLSLFAVGVGLSGWLKSAWLGLVSTVSMVLALVLILWALAFLLPA